MHIYIYISFNISKDWTTLPTSIQHAHEAASLLSPPKKHETLNIAVLSWKGASSSNQFFSCHFRGPFLLFVGCIFYLYSLLICFPSILILWTHSSHHLPSLAIFPMFLSCQQRHKPSRPPKARQRKYLKRFQNWPKKNASTPNHRKTH